MGGGESGCVDAVVLLTTVDRPEKARELARALVDARLAACVSLLNGLTSIYRWNDDIAEDSETLLLIKTCSEQIERLQTWFSEHHPYDVPEFLVFRAAAGSDSYLSWLEETTQSQGAEDK